MTKADLVTKISKTTQVEESIVSPIIESFMATVKESLAKDENVNLRGFGSFVVVQRKQKTGRNISEQKNIIIPAQNVPKFKPSSSFKELTLSVPVKFPNAIL
jgi:DNA-binding protein HU-beta